MALYDESVDPAPLSLPLLKAITKNFSQGQQIGTGGFGEVYKGELRNGTVAVKKLYSAIVIDEKNFQSEVDSLLGVKHKNTVRFLGYCSDTQQVMDKFNGVTVWAEQRQRLLCFEFLPKGSLADYITDPSAGLLWETRYKIIKGICEGVHYLHQQHIIHMDLKPQNILLDGNMMPKVADFGQSRRLSEDQSRTITQHIVGSWRYCAPEFIGSGVITKKNDIYGLGVIFLEVLTGCKGTDKVEDVLESWMNVLETTQGHHIPLEQVKLCAEIGIQCMNDDPKNRPTTWDVILMLFDEEEISNWSARGVVRSASITQEMPLIAKLEYEMKLMNLYGRPFLPKRVSALKRIEEASTKTIHLGFTDSKILDIHPLKLQFGFEAGKRTSCPLSLTSKADQYVLFSIIPEFKDMYSCEENELVHPMSTCDVSITLVEQQQRPLKMIYILMITSESKSALDNFMTSISWDDMMEEVDLPQRVEELGCQMHVAMVTGAVCPQSSTAITPKIIVTEEFKSTTTMDVHPTEPWILVVENLRQVSIWDYQTQSHRE
ncbi:cysteine-rich receptor-like protein kinase 25 [Triticum urartu]|uniref:cysteine-rich receptor-like protein kinase 25 n=1 Tax=Triticum urartu TaxID=4572 RepID=UPI002044C172|nr:cysteine-rich receptor-like protein kinase 25 [Triticum urartu]XP_048546902.1 cysteine-rich receptor-like protein kinase 25 [Triticum urartu]